MSDGLASRCKVCVARIASERRAVDPEGSRARLKRYREKHPERVRALAAVYRESPTAKAKQKVRNREWLRKNPAKNRAKVRAYDARKLRAIPPWANLQKIQAFYDEAVRLTRVTGIPHEVDHIVPLNHPLVTGLHVEFNLRVVTAAENAAKKNRYWPGMLECQRVVP